MGEIRNVYVRNALKKEWILFRGNDKFSDSVRAKTSDRRTGGGGPGGGGSGGVDPSGLPPRPGRQMHHRKSNRRQLSKGPQ